MHFLYTFVKFEGFGAKSESILLILIIFDPVFANFLTISRSSRRIFCKSRKFFGTWDHVGSVGDPLLLRFLGFKGILIVTPILLTKTLKKVKISQNSTCNPPSGGRGPYPNHSSVGDVQKKSGVGASRISDPLLG